MRELKPFDEEELELVWDSLAALNSIDFFRRFAKYKSDQLMNRFDSIPADERNIEFERLAAQRAVLHNLAEEAARANQDRNATTLTETQNEIPVE